MVIGLKLKLADIDKNRIYTAESGTKYLDLILMDTRDGLPDKYGQDGFCAHSVSKEEREAKVRGGICGNWKWLVRPDVQPAAKPHFTKPPPAADDEEIPF